MSKRRYHRRAKMKRRGVKNGSHNGSKIKMAPWRPLGGPWARPCCQTLPGAVPERLWHGPGRPKKFILAALERPWSEKWIDFGLLEGPREGPGGGLGGHLGSFLAVGPAGTKKLSCDVPQPVFQKMPFENGWYLVGSATLGRDYIMMQS